MNDRDRIEGVLLGTAIGDALGLPAEGMRPESIARRFGRVDRYLLLGRTGFVSDDTEQTALVATAIAMHAHDEAAMVAAFRRSLGAWFLRLPWGLGLTTLRACTRIVLGFRRTGIAAAGNGSAMRSAIVGACFPRDDERRARVARALSEVTHTDSRAVEASIFAADVAAAEGDARARVVRALGRVDSPELRERLERALELARRSATFEEAALELGTTGFVVHTVAFAAFAFARDGEEPPEFVLPRVIGAGGDTDTIAAVVGAWLGARHGASAFPTRWVEGLARGPFGVEHLRRLTAALEGVEREGNRGARVEFSAFHAFVRNLALYPVVLAHAFSRLVPW